MSHMATYDVNTAMLATTTPRGSVLENMFHGARCTHAVPASVRTSTTHGPHLQLNQRWIEPVGTQRCTITSSECKMFSSSAGVRKTNEKVNEEKRVTSGGGGGLRPSQATTEADITQGMQHLDSEASMRGESLIQKSSQSIISKDRPLTFLEKLALQQDMERKTIELRNKELRKKGIFNVRTSESTESTMRKLLDDDERLKERKKLMLEASKGYWADYTELAHMGVKFWSTSRRVRSKLISPLMMELTGIDMSTRKLTRLHDISRGKPTVYFVQFNEFGRRQNEPYLDLLRSKFPNGIVQSHKVLRASQINPEHGLPVGSKVMSLGGAGVSGHGANSSRKPHSSILTSIQQSNQKQSQQNHNNNQVNNGSSPEIASLHPEDVIDIPEKSFQIVTVDIDSSLVWQVIRGLTLRMETALKKLRSANKDLDSRLANNGHKLSGSKQQQGSTELYERINEHTMYLGLGSKRKMKKQDTKTTVATTVKSTEDIKVGDESKIVDGKTSNVASSPSINQIAGSTLQNDTHNQQQQQQPLKEGRLLNPKPPRDEIDFNSTIKIENNLSAHDTVIAAAAAAAEIQAKLNSGKDIKRTKKDISREVLSTDPMVVAATAETVKAGDSRRGGMMPLVKRAGTTGGDTKKTVGLDSTTPSAATATLSPSSSTSSPTAKLNNKSILDTNEFFKLKPTDKEEFDIERLRCGLFNDTLGWVLVVDKDSRIRWIGHGKLEQEACEPKFRKIKLPGVPESTPKGKLQLVKSGGEPMTRDEIDSRRKRTLTSSGWETDSEIFERIVKTVVLDD